jgi:hypothetical protein
MDNASIGLIVLSVFMVIGGLVSSGGRPQNSLQQRQGQGQAGGRKTKKSRRR